MGAEFAAVDLAAFFGWLAAIICIYYAVKINREFQDVQKEISELKKTLLPLQKDNKDLKEQLRKANSVQDRQKEILDLQSRIKGLESELKNLNDKNKKISEERNAWKEKASELEKVYKASRKENESQVENLGRRIEDLIQKIGLLEKEKAGLKRNLDGLANQNVAMQQRTEPSVNIVELQNAYNDIYNKYWQETDKFRRAKEENGKLRIENDKLLAEIAELRKDVVKKPEQLFLAHPQVPKNDLSMYFALELTSNIVFVNEEYGNIVLSLKDCGDIEEFLKNSDYKNADKYYKLVQAYIKELDDSFGNVNGDTEEIPMLCADKFARCFKDYFAESILDSIYNGMKTGEKFYYGLIDKINKYLQNHGIYTKQVQAGMIYEKMPYMEATKEATTDNSQHKHIKEVLLLPYYINYIDEDGRKREKLISKGRCIVLSAK